MEGKTNVLFIEIVHFEMVLYRKKKLVGVVFRKYLNRMNVSLKQTKAIIFYKFHI